MRITKNCLTNQSSKSIFYLEKFILIKLLNVLKPPRTKIIREIRTNKFLKMKFHKSRKLIINSKKNRVKKISQCILYLFSYFFYN
jgi:hypothetical protein